MRIKQNKNINFSKDALKSFFSQKTKENNHYDYIDALRGLAILGVIMVHTGQFGTMTISNVLKNIVDNGAMGVQLFYLASAFTLFLSMKNRVSKEYNPTRNFFIRRFFRIAPLYYIAIIYYLWQNGFGSRYYLGDATHISIANILSNVFFLHGFNPYWINSLVPGGWSIAVEMMFYAMVPFLFSKIKNIRHAFNFLIITILITLILNKILNIINPINSNYLWQDYLYFYLPSQLPIFALGISMYFIVIEKQSLTEISGKSLLIFSFILLGQLFSGKYNFFSKQTIFGIGFFVFSIAISRYKFKFIVNSIFSYVGKISFSMYLIHFSIIHWSVKMQFNFVNFYIRYLIIVILTVIVSTLTYHIIEIPFQKLGKRIINSYEKKGNNKNCNQ